jgi:hypothetical protein
MRYPLRLLIIVGAVLSLITISCGGGGGGSGDAATPDTGESTYSVYANPTDGRLFTETEDDGTSVTYYGTKDDDGSPQSLDHIVVKDASGTNEYVYKLNGDRIEKIYAPDGIVFSFEPSTGTPTNLKISTESGDFQFDIPIEFQSSITGDGTVDMISQVASDASTRTDFNIAASSTTKAIYYLRVMQCGKPVDDALVKMYIYPEIGSSDLIGKPISNGWYAFEIPQFVPEVRDWPSSKYLANCEKIGNKLISSNFCNYWKEYKKIGVVKIGTATVISQNLCQDIDYLLGIYGSFIPDKHKAIANEKISEIKQHCPDSLINHIPRVCKDGGDPSYFTKVCKEEYIDIIEPDPQAPYSVVFDIKIGSQEAFQTEGIVYVPGTDYEMEIDAPSIVALKEFYTDPTPATTTAWYTAYASLTCADPDYGTKVTLSVDGSDLYEASYEEEIYADATLHLDVPPVTKQEDLEKGVTDIITVTAEGLSAEPIDVFPASFQGTAADEGETKTWIIGVARTGTGTSDPEPDPEPPVDTCDNPPSTATGQAGKYYYVKAMYYPMPDHSSCFTAEQIEDFRARGDYILEDETRGACTVCSSGYYPAEYNGSETCVSCPSGTQYWDECCK